MCKTSQIIISRGTALHASKDFAVSMQCYHCRHPCYRKRLRGALGFRRKRLCSHLVTFVRQALPATRLHARQVARVRARTFLSIKANSYEAIISMRTYLL